MPIEYYAVLWQKRKLVLSMSNKALEFYTHSEEWCKELREMVRSAQCVYLGLNSHSVFEQEESEVMLSKYL